MEANKRLLTEKEGMTYTAFGRSKFREWASSIGAAVRLGRSVRYDQSVIDRKLDEEIAAQTAGREEVGSAT